MKIIAVSLRNFKCYESTESIPLFFDDQKFVGFLGENGVGKSAVLEGLYSFFTNQKWNRNKTGKKGESQCGVAPIVNCKVKEIPKEYFSPEEFEIVKKYSNDIVKSIVKKDLLEQEKINDEDIFISCMCFQNGEIKLFDGNKQAEECDNLAKKIKTLITSHFKYIYISSEVDIDNSTDINSKTIGLIKGSGVVGEVAEILRGMKIGNKSIAEVINNMVVSYLDGEVVKKLQETDANYNYKNLRKGAISKLTEKQLSELAMQALCGNRELTKKIKGKDIGISDMSSGQRRKAFLDFIIVMIGNLKETERRKIILAIDEPEISVDASSKVHQFEKLRELSENGPDVIFTTHWYGWVAQLTNGNVILIKESDADRNIFASSVDNFLGKDVKEKTPYEMRTIFDFLSSLGAWSEINLKQKFLVCEGPTDFNYITKHFPEYKVMPVRGVSKVIKLCKIFSDYYWDREGKGPSNVAFLIDTDPDKSREWSEIKSSNLKRISKTANGLIEIVNENKNLAERCAIEDLLSPESFKEALLGAKDVLIKKSDQEFIEKIRIKHPNEVGPRAFGLDDIEKEHFRSIFKSDFKLKTSRLYKPKEKDKEIFRKLLKLF